MKDYTSEFKEKFTELYILRFILDNCLIIDFLKIKEHSINFVFTEVGEKIYKEISQESKFDSNLLKFIFFLKFHGSDLLIDIEKTDLTEVIENISDLITKNIIFFPYIYGRSLYDKYYEEFQSQNSLLNYDDTIKLLDSTKKGVFQVENYIIGAFGLMKSKTNRKLFPQKKMPLYHCSNSNCSIIHEVEFSFASSKNPIKYIYSLINAKIENNENLDTSNLYIHDQALKGYYKHDTLYSVPELIAETLHVTELRILVAKLIDSEKIRSYIPLKLRKKSTEDITENLNESECLSIILICDNIKIIEIFEELVESNNIIIPISEIREPKNKKEFGHYGTYMQSSKLGTRVLSVYDNFSISKLTKLIKDLYQAPPLDVQLEWMLRKYSHLGSIEQKIDLLVKEENPKEIVRKYILNGQFQLDSTFKKLNGYFKIPKTEQDDEYAIEKILWKLGFDVQYYPNDFYRFWDNLDEFEKEVLKQNEYNALEKSTIRSKAVNLFVSMEEILQKSLSFSCWMLLSDHFINTKFAYIYEDARKFMVSILNNYEYSEGKKLTLDEKGKNTLFPLIEGLRSLISLCESKIKDIDKYTRSEQEFPFSYKKDQLSIFPFKHKIFLLDISSSSFEDIKQSILDITSELSRGNVISIRNRLQHQRDDFPKQNEILKSIQSIRKSFTIMEDKGLFPNLHLFSESTTDQYRRIKFIYKDYKDRTIEQINSPELDTYHMPSLHDPCIFINSIGLGNSNLYMRFKYKENSKYFNMWKNFPRKKIK